MPIWPHVDRYHEPSSPVGSIVFSLVWVSASSPATGEGRPSLSRPAVRFARHLVLPAVVGVTDSRAAVCADWKNVRCLRSGAFSPWRCVASSVRMPAAPVVRFAENIHALAGRHQRRTRSQARALHALGHALGGVAAARLADVLGLRTSADTARQELRRAPGRKRKPRPRVVGIDDSAIARGHQDGTYHRRPGAT